ncbi:adenylate/guanylate cyclase domain-containing protein, partial [Elusimicrobiota bacterium]
ITAEDGEEGLDMVSEHNPDLILMDVMMPKKDGIEVCQILKNDIKTRLTPIVLITGISKKEDRIAGIEAGADDFLTKPIDKRELIVRVRSLLRMKSLQDELQTKNILLDKILNRYVADEVYAQIMKDPEKHLKLGGEKKRVTVIFADIRGFSNLSENRGPVEIVDFLNKTFSALIQIIPKYNGIFNKYLGDGIMAYYNTPPDDIENTLNVLRTAMEMQKVFSDLRKQWEDTDFSSSGMGFGISTGEVFLGNIGTEKMMEYTIIGDTVNTSQRLQALASSNQIIISDSTYQVVKDRVHISEMPFHHLRGMQKEVVAYELINIIDETICGDDSLSENNIMQKET